MESRMDFIYLKDGSFIRADTIAAVKVIFDDTYGARVAVHYVVGQTREVSVVTYKLMDAAMMAAREIVEEVEAATQPAKEAFK